MSKDTVGEVKKWKGWRGRRRRKKEREGNIILEF
jgi:hypothetical protein